MARRTNSAMGAPVLSDSACSFLNCLLSGTRDRRPHHSTPARPSRPGYHSKISPHRDQQSLLHIQPTGFAALPCFHGGQAYTAPTLLAAGRDGTPEAGSGGRLPPLRRSLSSTAWDVALHSTAACHDRNRGVPHGISGRSSGALRLLRSRAALLRQLPRPSLPKVPVARACGVGREANIRSSPDALFSCRLLRPRTDRFPRLPEQRGRFRHSVSSHGRDLVHHRCRSPTSGGPDRLLCGTP